MEDLARVIGSLWDTQMVISCEFAYITMTTSVVNFIAFKVDIMSIVTDFEVDIMPIVTNFKETSK